MQGARNQECKEREIKGSGRKEPRMLIKGRLKVQGARNQECKEREIKGAGRKEPRM